MSVVRFAQICDKCGARSVEYGGWFTCRECMEDVCPACAAPGTLRNDEGIAECICQGCQGSGSEKELKTGVTPDPIGASQQQRQDEETG